MSAAKYKLRAKCFSDIISLYDGEKIKIIKVVGSENAPDVEVEFLSTLTLLELKEVINNIPDGHVMFETVSESDQYTGRRTYPEA